MVLFRYNNFQIDIYIYIYIELPCCYTASLAACSHLDSGFGEVYLERQLLSCVNVGVVSLREHSLELLQLRARESRSDPPLFPLLIQPRGVGEELVGY